MSNRILALDPGVANLGAAVMEKISLDDHPGFRWEPIHLACLQTKASDKVLNIRQSSDLVRRLQEQSRALKDLIRAFNIRRVVAEIPDTGARSAAALRHLMLSTAFVVTAAEWEELAIEIYTPKETREAAGVPKGVRKDAVVKKIVMATMGKKYPLLIEMFPHANKQEHVADALSVFEAARNGVLVRSS